MKPAERGNILFLILLAVVLFAALSYAVTSSTNGGAKNASTEQMQLDAARIMAQGTLVANIVQRSMMMNNIPDYMLDLYPPATGATNSQCQDNYCKMYSSSGGGLSPFMSTERMYEINSTLISGVQGYLDNPTTNGVPRVVRIKGVGTEEGGDLVWAFTYINNKLCREINKALGMANTYPLDGPNDLLQTFNVSSAQFPEPPAGHYLGDVVPELIGKTEFCFTDGKWSQTKAFYIKVLVAR